MRPAAEAKFEQLVSDNLPSVLAYARRRVDEYDDAADVAAETFLIAWRRIDEVPDADQARLWLFGVARRVLLNVRRGQRRRSALAANIRQFLPTVGPDPAERIDGRAPQIRAAIRELPEGEREVIALTYWEDLTPSQIATVLEIPAVTVRTRLHRARRSLRRDLSRMGLDPADTHASDRTPTKTLETPR